MSLRLAQLAPTPGPPTRNPPIVQYYEEVPNGTPQNEHEQYRNHHRLSSSTAARPSTTPPTEQVTPPGKQYHDDMHDQNYNPDDYPIQILEQIYQTHRAHVHDPTIECEECVRVRADLVYLPMPVPVERYGHFAGTRLSELPAFYLAESEGNGYVWQKQDIITLSPFRFVNENGWNRIEDGSATKDKDETVGDIWRAEHRLPLPQGWVTSSGMAQLGEWEEQRVLRAANQSGGVVDVARTHFAEHRWRNEGGRWGTVRGCQE